MDCNELKVPAKLVIHCRQNEETVQSRIFLCFFKLYFEDFKKIFWHNCVTDSILYTIEEQLKIAFEYGLFKFYIDIRMNGWEERGASVRTALFAYCFNQLRALTKFMRTHPGNQYEGDPDVAIESKSKSLSHVFSEVAEKELTDFEYALYERAFAELDERCKNFIRWRLNQKTDNEIADKYPDVDFESRDPADITYRCVQKLKRIVDKQKVKIKL